MATLQKIRSKAGLLIGVLGFALLAFILGEFLNSGSTLFNKSKDKAFAVDGTIVRTQEYQDRVTEMEEFQKMMSGMTSLTEEQSAQVKESVYQQMVKEMILDSEASKLGLAVTAEEMNDLVYGENISPILSQMFGNPQTGQVNTQVLTQFLAIVHMNVSEAKNDNEVMQIQQAKYQWRIIENMIKYQRLEEKYTSLVAGGLMVSDIEAKANFEGTKRSADIAYVMQPYSSIADSTMTVTDSEIKSLYDKRKNNFKTQFDIRKISYFVKDVVPSTEDIAEIEKQMATIKEELATSDNPGLVVSDYSSVPFVDAYVSVNALNSNVKEFAQTANAGDILGPLKDAENYTLYKVIDRTVKADSVKLQLINIPEGADKALSNHIADSLITVIKGGKDFAVVANELNPQANGGEVGWATEELLASSNLGKDFIASVFSAASGDIVKIPNRGVIQIVKVQEKTQPVSKVKLASVVVPITVSDKTLNTIDSELNNFLSEYGNSDNFVKGANEKGYNLVADVMVNPSEHTLNRISGSRQVINWAYTNKVGTVKKFDLEEKRIIAIITKDLKKGYIPYNEPEIYNMLKAELVKDKKAEKLLADISAKPASTLDAYAQNLNAKVDTARFVNFTTPSIQGLGAEPIMNVYAAHGKVNTISGPQKGESGVLVLSVLSTQDSQATYDAKTIKEQLQRNFYYIARYTINSLFEVKKVEDNRVKFF